MNLFERQNDLFIQHRSTSIQSYMTQVYGWMTVGLLLTTFVSWYAIHNINFMNYLESHGWLLFSFVISEFFLVIFLSFFLSKLSGAAATTMFMLYSGLTGMTVSLVLIHYSGVSVVSAFFTSAIVFGVLSFYGYTTKRDLNGLGNFLFMALSGLIIASLVNFIIQNTGFSIILTYLGVFIFSGLTAYNTQRLRNIGYKIINIDGEDEILRKYVILGALTLYLDFINLFLIFLRITGSRR